MTEIGSVAFSGCKSLVGITIPDSVIKIGKAAFSGCDNLTMTVGHGSYAEQYAMDNGINYMYMD